ncbi:MAG: carboxypeptidase regulatory-like domain-containing protein [Dehalococcoidia bacterium]|nr:carboxypeptidase regulatory-like domain-containing protein [Dehalococcoidia bacterium]
MKVGDAAPLRPGVPALALAFALLAAACGSGGSRISRDCVNPRSAATAACVVLMPSATADGSPGAGPSPTATSTATPLAVIIQCVPGYVQGGERCVPDGTGTPARPTASPQPGAMQTPTPGGGSGIEGQVLVGPTCPVERADSPCADRPAQLYVWAIAQPTPAGGAIAASVRSDADGRFRLALPPGTYTLDGGACPPGTTCAGGFPRVTRLTVVVTGGAFTEVRLRGDTGIR